MISIQSGWTPERSKESPAAGLRSAMPSQAGSSPGSEHQVFKIKIKNGSIIEPKGMSNQWTYDFWEGVIGPFFLLTFIPSRMASSISRSMTGLLPSA